jgi:nitrilase
MVVSVGVNERDGGTLYTQLLFGTDGTLIQHRRKISPTYRERMLWRQAGLRAVDSEVGRIGQLACWEHYNPLARYALMADGEQIHSAMYPGSFGGDIFSEQIQVNIRQHALEGRLLGGRRQRLAGRRSAGPDHAGDRLPHQPDLQWLLYRDCLAAKAN